MKKTFWNRYLTAGFIFVLGFSHSGCYRKVDGINNDHLGIARNNDGTVSVAYPFFENADRPLSAGESNKDGLCHRYGMDAFQAMIRINSTRQNTAVNASGNFSHYYPPNRNDTTTFHEEVGLLLCQTDDVVPGIESLEQVLPIPIPEERAEDVTYDPITGNVTLVQPYAIWPQAQKIATGSDFKLPFIYLPDDLGTEELEIEGLCQYYGLGSFVSVQTSFLNIEQEIKLATGNAENKFAAIVNAYGHYSHYYVQESDEPAEIVYSITCGPAPVEE